VSKFTAGPWKRYERTDGGFVITTQKGLSPVSIANVIIRRDLHEFEANANLLAAAPELYEACEAALNMVETDQGPPNWDLLRAALRKARGQS
jgi:hypothetical protein